MAPPLEVPKILWNSTPEISHACRRKKRGVAILSDSFHHVSTKRLTINIPDGLLGWLENEARRSGQPKSALVRQILQEHQERQRRSALDLAADLCGCVQSGLRDLARNQKHLKGFGQ